MLHRMPHYASFSSRHLQYNTLEVKRTGLDINHFSKYTVIYYGPLLPAWKIKYVSQMAFPRKLLYFSKVITTIQHHLFIVYCVSSVVPGCLKTLENYYTPSFKGSLTHPKPTRYSTSNNTANARYGSSKQNI